MALTVSGFTYEPEVCGIWVSGADYSAAATYLFMAQDTTDEQAVTAGAGGQIVGIRINKPNTGEAVEMVTAKIAPLTLGGNVTRGDKLKSDASGQGVTTVTDRDEIGAIALRSGVSGDVIPVLVRLETLSHS